MLASILRGNLSVQGPIYAGGWRTRHCTPSIGAKGKPKQLLYDFVTGKVIFPTIVKRRTSGVRRDKSDTQRHAGGRVTALQRRPSPLIG